MAGILDAFKPVKYLDFILGVDADGNNLIANLCDMPHVLIGGSTGSGKSNFIHSIITCLISKYSKDDLQLILIDPKLVEYNEYLNVPHVTKLANTREDCEIVPILDDLYAESIRRYGLFKTHNVKSIQDFNGLASYAGKLPYRVVIIDEFADLFYNEDVTDALIKVTQISRATGIHFIIATQRPSADIINGKIKANFPARVAFKMPSSQDSMTILGCSSADTIKNVGDFVYTLSGVSEIHRARAVWTPTEYARTTAAALITKEYRNLQRPIEFSVRDNYKGYDVRNLNDAYGGVFTLGDLNMAIIKIYNDIPPIVNADYLIGIATGRELRKCIIRELQTRGVLRDCYVDEHALKREVQKIVG